MYKLMVSHDCGMNYKEDSGAGTLGELEERCKELDAQYLRWYIDHGGRPLAGFMCGVHRNILGTIKALSEQE